MAEGGEPPIQKICYKSTIGSKERKTIVHGDKVETEHDTRAEECGAVAPSASSRGSKEEKMTLAESNVQLTPGSEKTPQERELDDLTNKVQDFISRLQYEEAISLLENSPFLKLDFYFPKLLLAECYLYLNDSECDWSNLIKNIKKALTSSELTADDLVERANNFIVNKFCVRAIIFLGIVSDIYREKEATPDGAVNGMQLCSNKIYSATEQLIKSVDTFLIGVKYGIKYMKMILRAMRSVKNVSPDNKALKEAWCYYYIGTIFQEIENYVKSQRCKNYKKSKKYLELGVQVLNLQFDSNALKYRIYGYTLHDLGNACLKLGKFSEAKSHFKKVIEVGEKATNFYDNSEKQITAELAKENLNRTRELLDECSTNSSYLSESDELGNNFAE